MKLTKDEARILTNTLQQQKYDFYHNAETKEETLERSKAIDDLEKRLKFFSQDERRIGRISQDDWSDMMKRFVKKHKTKILKDGKGID